MTREFLIYIVFLVIIIAVVSIYVYRAREGYYPYAGPVYGGPWTSRPWSGGPWNMPTRDIYYPYPYGGYPYGYSNKWFYDIRGPPLTYQPTELPGPKPSENTTNDDKDTGDSSAGPVSTVTNTVDIPINKTTNRNRALAEYESESKWWPGWARWDGGWWGGPFFNYGLLYDINGELKNSRNNSIVANHAWPWAWWF